MADFWRASLRSPPSALSSSIMRRKSLFGAMGSTRPGGPADYYRLLFVTQEFLVIMWVVSVVLLGMGGLLRKSARRIDVHSRPARFTCASLRRARRNGNTSIRGVRDFAVVRRVSGVILSRITDSCLASIVLRLALVRRRAFVFGDGLLRLFRGRRRIHRARNFFWHCPSDRDRVRRLAPSV